MKRYFIYTFLIVTGILNHAISKQMTPFPSEVLSVDHCVISLNGKWSFSSLPVDSVYKQNVSWNSINVPGEIRMQGFDISHDQEMTYYKEVPIPSDFQGKTILIHFESVYNHAKVWVNGHFIKEHFGGFTPWQCNITNYVTPGENAVIHVGVTDRKDDISMGSGYAKHLLGGIIRDVSLLAVPQTHIRHLNIETSLDDEYKNAIVQLRVGIKFKESKSVKLNYALFSPTNKKVKLSDSSVQIKSSDHDIVHYIPVKSPLKWDAEHPNLYTLQLNLKVDGKVVEQIEETLGFREVKRIDNHLFVNGREVKLRGVDRHSTHALTGRTLTPELEEQDVLLAKEANINFIRNSHYPCSEIFLDYCDQYGLYVEDETAVTFIDVNHDATQNNSEFTERYLSQVQEMVHSHYNHPSIIAWSIANESVYGSNLQKCYDWIKTIDQQRPVVISYPSTVPDSVRCYDIISVHYPFVEKFKDEITSLYDPRIQKDNAFKYNHLPVLYDEWVHVPAYNIKTINQDPNVRNFWGHSIQKIWDACFNEEGRLGGAIWCMIDDVFCLPPTENDSASSVSKFGSGEWGFVDSWRRKKPEFWHTRKGYSPIRIQNKSIVLQNPSDPLVVSVQNRFDHTNLNELLIQWKYNDQSGVLKNVSIEPHAYGILEFPMMHWAQDSQLRLEFYSQDQWLFDEFVLPIHLVNDQHDKNWVAAKEEHNNLSKIQINESDHEVQFKSDIFQMTFEKESGLISKGLFNDQLLIQSGPHLQLDPYNLESWSLNHFSYRAENYKVIVNIQGMYGEISVHYKLHINSNGNITTQCVFENLPLAPHNNDEWWPRTGYNEVGVSFIVSGQLDRLAWNRNAQWTVYPADHIGRAQGIAKRYRNEGVEQKYNAPDWPWSQDMNTPYLTDLSQSGFGATHDFRSQKENVFWGSIYENNSGNGLKILSDGTQSLRVEPVQASQNASLKLIVNAECNYPDLGWGCYMKKEKTLPNPFEMRIEFQPTKE